MKDELDTLYAITQAETLDDINDIVKNRSVDLKRIARHSGQKTQINVIIDRCEDKARLIDHRIEMNEKLIAAAEERAEEIIDHDIQKLHDLESEGQV